MIRVELGEEVGRRGVWLYSIPQFGVQGRSRQPLLDACRKIKALDEATASQQIGLYRRGKNQPDMTCRVDWGADKTVDEGATRFARWKEFRWD